MKLVLKGKKWRKRGNFNRIRLLYLDFRIALLDRRTHVSGAYEVCSSIVL